MKVRKSQLLINLDNFSFQKAELSQRSYTLCLNYCNAVVFKLCSKEIRDLAGDCPGIRKHISLTINLENIILIIFYYNFLFADDSFSTFSTGFIISVNDIN